MTTDSPDRLHDCLSRLVGDMGEDLVLPTQFVTPSLSVNDTRERNLRAAVILDGIKNFMTLALATDHRRRARFQKEWVYFMSSDRTWDFSFENLCDVFNFNANTIRTALIKWVEGARREAQAQADQVSESYRRSGALPQGWPDEAEECTPGRFEELAEGIPG